MISLLDIPHITPYCITHSVCVQSLCCNCLSAPHQSYWQRVLTASVLWVLAAGKTLHNMLHRITVQMCILVGSRCKVQDRKQIKNTDNTQTKHNPEEANNTKHSKKAWFSRLLRHSAGNDVGLFNNAPEPTWSNEYVDTTVYWPRTDDKRVTPGDVAGRHISCWRHCSYIALVINGPGTGQQFPVSWAGRHVERSGVDQQLTACQWHTDRQHHSS